MSDVENSADVPKLKKGIADLEKLYMEYNSEISKVRGMAAAGTRK